MKNPKYTNEQQVALLTQMAAKYGNTVTSQQISEFCKDMPYPYFLTTEKYRVGRDKYQLIVDPSAINNTVAAAVAIEISPKFSRNDNLIPDVEQSYVPFGFFNDLKNIIESKIFYPVYVTGLSGNGKTYMIQQACAAAKREFVRVNITKETDENDLIGSYELVDGNTIWRDGPVLIAMRRGAILFLDETDYGSERLLCLQPILEGKGYFNKKKGEYIEPSFGFNIMATANTKGKGSDDGRFIGANILNEAFLERFAITIEQEYPSEQTERKILEKLFVELDQIERQAGRLGVTEGMLVKEFSANLTKWAELIRKSHADGAVDEIISTRRLVHICKAYMIFRNKRKAIELCLNRFDAEVKTVYLDFYGKIDKNIDAKVVEPTKPAPALATVAPTVTKSAPIAPSAPAPVAPAAPIVNSTGNKPVFGSAQNIASVGIKYKTKVSVVFDQVTKDAIVSSHGMQTNVKLQEYVNATDDVLDRVVGVHSLKMSPARLP